MKNILAIDYGRMKMGLAVSENNVAIPLKVIRISGDSEAIEKITKIINSKNIEEVIVGVSRGEMKEEILSFTKFLKEKLSVDVKTWDENFSTKMANAKAIEAGIKRKKRKEMEDAYAAALILQDYLEDN